MGNNIFTEVLESYTIIDDPNVIAIESIIYEALESDTAKSDLKKNLRALTKAKANNDDASVKEAKKDVDESIRELNSEANKEKDENKKAKLKKAAKIGAIIAGTVATAASIAVAAKMIKNNKNLKNELDAIVKDNSDLADKYGSVIKERDSARRRVYELLDDLGKIDEVRRNAVLYKDRTDTAQVARLNKVIDTVMRG